MQNHGLAVGLGFDSTAYAVGDASAWFEDSAYDLLTGIADLENWRFALPEMGSELVTGNRTFDSDISGWTLGQSGSGGTAQWNAGGKAEITRGSANTWLYKTSPVTVEVGKTYEFSASVRSSNGTTGALLRLYSAANASGNLASATSSTSTTETTVKGYWTASVASVYPTVLADTTGTGTIEFDNISIKEVVLTATGRTYGSELITNGDCATATTFGSELVTNGAFGTDISGWTANRRTRSDRVSLIMPVR